MNLCDSCVHHQVDCVHVGMGCKVNGNCVKCDEYKLRIQ